MCHVDTLSGQEKAGGGVREGERPGEGTGDTVGSFKGQSTPLRIRLESLGCVSCALHHPVSRHPPCDTHLAMISLSNLELSKNKARKVEQPPVCSGFATLKKKSYALSHVPLKLTLSCLMLPRCELYDMGLHQ